MNSQLTKEFILSLYKQTPYSNTFDSLPHKELFSTEQSQTPSLSHIKAHFLYLHVTSPNHHMAKHSLEETTNMKYQVAGSLIISKGKSIRIRSKRLNVIYVFVRQKHMIYVLYIINV
jgi:hypothetical protein